MFLLLHLDQAFTSTPLNMLSHSSKQLHICNVHSILTYIMCCMLKMYFQVHMIIYLSHLWKISNTFPLPLPLSLPLSLSLSLSHTHTHTHKHTHTHTHTHIHTYTQTHTLSLSLSH